MIYLFNWKVILNPNTRLNSSMNDIEVKGYALRINLTKNSAKKRLQKSLEKIYYNSGYNKTTSKIEITDTI